MGTRLVGAGTEKVYAAAKSWVDCTLRSDGSLFTPGKQIWTRRWLGELHRRFLDKPDKSKGSFLDKLQRQLEGSPPEVYQLMGEVLYVHFLIVGTSNSADEQQRINTVLRWSHASVEIPPHLVAALTPGIANPGAGFHTYRPFQVGLLIEFVEQWKGQDDQERERLLKDPWAFKEFLIGMRLNSRLLRNNQNTPRIQRQALLHLTYPDTFEAIVNIDHKNMIAKAFQDSIADATEDVDRKLEQIRAALEGQHVVGDYFFYQPEIRAQWDNQYDRDLWGDFIRRAQTYVDSGKLATEEVDYKLKMGGRLAEARESVLAGSDDWGKKVKAGIAGNLVHPIEQSKFRHWVDEAKSDALLALQALWVDDDALVDERVRDFNELLPRSVSRGPGTRTTLMSVLLMGLDVEQYPPFRVTVFGEAYGRTGYPLPDSDTEEKILYSHALSFLDLFIEEAQARKLAIANRIEAQSLVWAILQARDEEPPAEENETPPVWDDPWSDRKIAELAEDLLWSPSDLRRIIDGLKDKRQVIFQGPPGTGKTYVAKRIAEWCKNHGGDYQIVQFHPSYSYENFVEGFRPTLDEGGNAGFKLTGGPLRRIAKQAEAKPDTTFILVIDEINRGNVSKVLGELYFLLEYRNEEITLQYSGVGFSLPENLWFIGTMNTTDRSIALVDAALRRRFYFFGFFPDVPPIQGLLERWLDKYSPDAKWISRLVDSANKEMGDRHLGIGPSHFMKRDLPLDQRRVRFIWEQAIIPYIEEQCFGNEEKLKQFGFDRLLGNHRAVQPEPYPGDNEDATPNSEGLDLHEVELPDASD